MFMARNTSFANRDFSPDVASDVTEESIINAIGDSPSNDDLVKYDADDGDLDFADDEGAVPRDLGETDTNSPAYVANQPDPATQTEAEEGTEEGIRNWSPLRVKQAIDAVINEGGTEGTEISRLIGISRSSDAAYEFTSLANGSLAVASLGNLPSGLNDPQGAAFDNDTGELWILNRTGGNSGNVWRIPDVDAPGTGTNHGSWGSISTYFRSAAFHNGVLYGGGRSGGLYRINNHDTNPAAVQITGYPSEFSFVKGMGFLDGVLYCLVEVSNSPWDVRIYRITDPSDPSTAQNLGEIPDSLAENYPQSVAFNDGRMYITATRDADHLWEFSDLDDPANPTDLGTYPNLTEAYAMADYTVSEPGSGGALPDPVDQDEAEAGTESGTRLWSPVRVHQAIDEGLSDGVERFAFIPESPIFAVDVPESKLRNGTTAQTGIVRLATSTQAIAGVSDSLAITTEGVQEHGDERYLRIDE